MLLLLLTVARPLQCGSFTITILLRAQQVEVLIWLVTRNDVNGRNRSLERRRKGNGHCWEAAARNSDEA